jgi:hypothetical protein
VAYVEGFMGPIGTNHGCFERIRLTARGQGRTIADTLVMMANTAARAAVLPNVAVRLSLLVLLLGILPGGLVI